MKVIALNNIVDLFDIWVPLGTSANRASFLQKHFAFIIHSRMNIVCIESPGHTIRKQDAAQLPAVHTHTSVL